MAPTPGQSSCQPLPSKELALFKKIIKCYEHKQYKIGLRCAKTILSNPQFAEHGETLAMRGLILNCVGKHAEAQESVKRGLKADLRSYVCWHVFGLVQRADKKFDEAVRAYKQALRIDSDNLQILRDLSLLQIQLRDYEGYRDCRYQLLRLRPTQRMSWIGYAIAYHLLEMYDKALHIVNEFCNNNEPAQLDFERSELILYQNMILRESGQLDLALVKLEENASLILDKLAFLETRAELLMNLGREAEAERVYRLLIDRNPENQTYYRALERCMGLGPDSPKEDRLAVLDQLSLIKMRATTPRRLALYLTEGEELRRRLAAWLISGLRKGVPSLFKSILPLYERADKVGVVESLLMEYVKRMEDKGYRNASLDDDSSHCESPTTAVWLYALVAQHFDRLRSTKLALNYMERALQHTPTLIELLIFKAKIHKHAGDDELAARVMNEAQSLDTADRFLNSKAAKYLLRAGRLEEAERMCAKFTRENVNASVSLTDMQCMWYETEVAKAHRRLGNYGEALRQCHQIEQHFVGIYEDQFDFHTYCLRKSTLCAYIRLLRLEDHIKGHEFYYRAAKIAIKIYLRMMDRPGDIWPEKTGESAKLTASEIKKQRRKANKEKAQKETEKKNNKENAKQREENDSTPSSIPDAETLLKTENPLDEVAKFVQPLLQLGSQHVTAYALAHEVYLRRNKVLLMVKSLKDGLNLDAEHPLLHVSRIKFLLYYNNANLTGIVKELTEEAMPLLFPDGVDPRTLNEAFKSKHINSFPHTMAVAESAILLDASCAASVKALLLRSLEEKLTGRTLPMVSKLLDGVKYGRFGPWTKEEIEALRRKCNSLFRDATVFGGGFVPPPTTDNQIVTEGDGLHHSFE